jgi:hypothetical protein
MVNNERISYPCIRLKKWRKCWGFFEFSGDSPYWCPYSERH